MPNTNKSGQIGTTAPRALKAKWEAECGRLKNDLDLTFRGRAMFPGNLQNGLVAWFLKKDKAERERIAQEALTLLESYEDSGSNGEPKYRGLPASRIRPKKPSSSNEAVG
jgi:hypothetical protein